MKEKERKREERKKETEKNGVGKKKMREKKLRNKVPMCESNPRPLNLQPSLPLSHCLRD